MEFTALEPWKLIVLMAAGGLFSLLGIWLMLRKKHTDPAKIEIFGLKFESSSAGLPVFLVGSVFLAVPVFVPPASNHAPDSERPNNARGIPLDWIWRGDSRDPPQNSDETRGSTMAGTGYSEGHVAASTADTNDESRATQQDDEPNNSLASANVISIDSTVQGTIEPGKRDFFFVETPGSKYGEIIINATSDQLILRVYDELGSEIWSESQPGQGWRSFRALIEHGAYYISLETWGEDPVRYELTATAQPR